MKLRLLNCSATETMTDKCTKEEPSSTTNVKVADSKTLYKQSPRVPPKKRVSRPVKHRLLNRQGSSSLEPKHREYRKYGHIKRVEFTMFVKILMQQLALSDKELHAQAQEVRKSHISFILHNLIYPYHCSHK